MKFTFEDFVWIQTQCQKGAMAAQGSGRVVCIAIDGSDNSKFAFQCKLTQSRIELLLYTYSRFFCFINTRLAFVCSMYNINNRQILTVYMYSKVGLLTLQSLKLVFYMYMIYCSKSSIHTECV